MNNTNKTCYIYLRVSTDEQAKEGFSIDNQKRACVEYAKNNGFEIIEIFTDDGRSARTTDRPAFQKMMTAAKEKPVDALIFYKVDRIFRNVGDFSRIRKEFLKNGD
jgi:site-specific DNA recombinase